MAASSNSSLSGSSVSSGKFLQRAPHFCPPSILAGATCLQSASPSHSPRPRRRRAQSPAGRSPGAAMPLPGVGCPSGGTEGRNRDGGGAAGPGSPPRLPTVPLCGVRERGAPCPAPSAGEQHHSWLGKGRARGPRASAAGAVPGAPGSRGAWGEEGIQRPARILCRGPRGTGLAPHRDPARRGALRRAGVARRATWWVLWHTSRFQYSCRTGNN